VSNLISDTQKKFDNAVAEPISLCLDQGSPKLWDDILTIFKDELADHLKSFQTDYKGFVFVFNFLYLYVESFPYSQTDFEYTDEEVVTACSELKFSLWQKLLAVLKAQMIDTLVSERLRNRYGAF
jgi:hypothetical protein